MAAGRRWYHQWQKPGEPQPVIDTGKPQPGWDRIGNALLPMFFTTPVIRIAPLIDCPAAPISETESQKPPSIQAAGGLTRSALTRISVLSRPKSYISNLKTALLETMGWEPGFPRLAISPALRDPSNWKSVGFPGCRKEWIPSGDIAYIAARSTLYFTNAGFIS